MFHTKRQNNNFANKEYKKNYYQLNKEKCNKSSKNWYLDNLDLKKEYDKELFNIYFNYKNGVTGQVN